MREEELGNAQNQPHQEDRDSIWSIPLSRRALYFGLFTVYALAGIGFLIWYEVFVHTADTWQQTILAITQGIGVNTVGAAGLALLTIEGPKTVMVVADYITQRWLNPLKERRRAEAERARAEAERIRAEAERIRAEAESARSEAESVRAEAESARSEAESARAEAERIRAESEAEAARIIAEAEADAERIRERGGADDEAQD